jgi:hypothetical protein
MFVVGSPAMLPRAPESMSHQPNLFSSHAPDGSAEPAHKNAPEPARSVPVWMRRMELFLRVAVRLYLGLLVMVLPWTVYWDDNHFLTVYPRVAAFASLGGVRGVVSGLGLLNLWIAVSEAIHYREFDA